MLNSPFCFVDIETTGGNPLRNRIIEIGIIRVENFKVVAEYKSLINPHSSLDPFIQNLTGISASDLERAPSFSSIKKDILELLVDSVFVAHNVRFDYGFVRSEFKREDISFSLKQLCTVKLARYLFPGFSHYNLDSIISNFEIPCESRHRAFDDAKVLWEFMQVARDRLGEEQVARGILHGLKRPTLPVQISVDTIDNLSESPGVYVFKNKEGAVLYVGKSINIRDRVLSHFSNDFASSTDMMLSQEAADIESIETSGELGALLLESSLIKSMQPIYNRMLRYARKLLIMKRNTSKSEYLGVTLQEVERIELEDLDQVIGVFRSRKEALDYLYKLSAESFLCPKLLGIEKSTKSCFAFQLGKCKGACVQKELPIVYNLRFEQAFYKKKIRPWKFNGPVIVKDGDEGFVVDKWCILGKVDHNKSLSDLSWQYTFDLDSYKILQRFLSKEENLRFVTTISSINNRALV
ncbi:MAG: GIY-YIG nuclease family protein [Candidatus Levybacteria bacterium]|nr:GIY-YIG nuclease family protein [Candidatus Levybacteria bacterium]